ncbi:MAG: hypothetical protein AAFV53_30000 [Myxococcota bacterium]
MSFPLSVVSVLSLLSTASAVPPTWTVNSIFNPSGEDLVAIAMVTVDSDHFFVAQLEDSAGASRLYFKKRDNIHGLSSRIDLSLDGSGVPRLDTTGMEQYLPTLAVDSGSRVLIANKVDGVGFGPTIENPILPRTAPFNLIDAPPELIDADATLTPRRKHTSLAVNSTAGTVFACFTVDDGGDDIYCNDRGMASTSWPSIPWALATSANVEEHATVAVLDDDTRVIMYADGTGGADTTNIKVEFYDGSNTLIGTGVELGNTNSNWPHLTRDGDVLHAVWANTGTDTLWYTTCDTRLSSCDSSGWLTPEQITNIPNAGAYPQIIVDDNDDIFVAFTHTSGAGDERVAVSTRCAAGSWDGVTIDNSQSTENLGGQHRRHAYPAFSFNDATGNIIAAYGREHATTGEWDGVRAAVDSNTYHTAFCP